MACEMEPPQNYSAIRLAHAYRSSPTASDVDDVAEIIRILAGKSKLEARPPVSASAVLRAEQILKIDARPLYTFSGCLHPKLGTIGLVINPQCLDRCLQGVSRCDSGGLAGRQGAFVQIPEVEVATALQLLSFAGADPSWQTAFSDELSDSYTSIRGYVAGDIPNHESWRDVRAKCIAAHDSTIDGVPDRRLWTWEVRLMIAPDASDYECVVISHEAFKRLEEIRRSGADVPTHVRLIRGGISAAGVHFFEDDIVVDALCGAKAA
jgi:hypothetical protein